MPWNRLILEDDKREVEMTIDVRVNSLGDVDPILTYYGAVRYRVRRGSDTIYPFRVLADGQLEWHPEYEDSLFKIHGEMIHPETVFVLHDQDEDRPQGYTYDLKITNFSRREI
jgi:hypothetical protein